MDLKKSAKLRKNIVCLESKFYVSPGNFILPPVATVVKFRMSGGMTPLHEIWRLWCLKMNHKGLQINLRGWKSTTGGWDLTTIGVGIDYRVLKIDHRGLTLDTGSWTSMFSTRTVYRSHFPKVPKGFINILGLVHAMIRLRVTNQLNQVEASQVLYVTDTNLRLGYTAMLRTGRRYAASAICWSQDGCRTQTKRCQWIQVVISWSMWRTLVSVVFAIESNIFFVKLKECLQHRPCFVSAWFGTSYSPWYYLTRSTLHPLLTFIIPNEEYIASTTHLDIT